MSKKTKAPASDLLALSVSAEIRQQAEMTASAEAASAPEQAVDLSTAQEMLQELRVHQIELKMQNEELRQAHDHLDEIREMYADLYDTAPVSYCSVTETGLILQSNQATTILLGQVKSKLFQQSISRFIYAYDQYIYYHMCKRLLVGGKPQTCELRIRKPNSTSLCLVQVTATVHEEGGRRTIRLTLDDDAERRKAQGALLDDDAGLRAILQTAVDAYWLVDAQGSLKEVSDTYSRISGYSERETLTSRRNDRDIATTISRIAARLGASPDLHEDCFESCHRRKVGPEFDVEVRIHRHPLNSGLFLVLLRDIT